jgi:hydrogenase maturation protease
MHDSILRFAYTVVGHKKLVQEALLSRLISEIRAVVIAKGKCLDTLGVGLKRMTSSSTDNSREPEEIWQISFEGKTVVVGLGNPYMRDDGIGIHAARQLKKSRNLGDKVIVYEYQAMDLSLLLQFKGATKIVLIDAVKSGSPAGTVSKYEITSKEGPLLKLPNLHELQLYDMLDIASETSLLACPVIVIGVEPKDVSLGEGLTNTVAGAFYALISEVKSETE